jgi:molybdate transport system substrate-binding protein
MRTSPDRPHAASVAVALAALLVSGCSKRPAAAAGTAAVKVAAASDLTYAFDELSRSFAAKTGQEIVFTFGSSGQLARQLAEGAPFDLFAAASVGFVEDVVEAGACDGTTTKLYGQGQLVLWAPEGGAVTPTTTLRDLTDPRFVKIAIANPEHAPYGKAAKEALVAAGVWDALAPKLVYGENIKQTMQFAESGNAEVAIVALSLALGSKHGVHAPVDPSLHRPLEQALVVCGHGENAAGARAFAAYVSSAEGRALMNHFGFVLPGEDATGSTK